MQLVIAEKPSVAKSFADVLGAKINRNGYYEGNGYFVSWCVGHLIEQAQPEAYDPRYAKWRREDLPILPNPWKFVVSEGTKKQYEVLKYLMHDGRVHAMVCATVLASGVPNHILSGVSNQLLSEAYEPIEECKMPTTQICSL